MKIILDVPEGTKAISLMLAILRYDEAVDSPKFDMIATSIEHPKDEATYKIVSPYDTEEADE